MIWHAINALTGIAIGDALCFPAEATLSEVAWLFYGYCSQNGNFLMSKTKHHEFFECSAKIVHMEIMLTVLIETFFKKF